jgi:putative Mg2+ transporter-C (MgtC) family protein
VFISLGQFAANAGLALFLGAVIGLEREFRARDAGIRTAALVAVGSAVFTMASRNWDNSGAVAGNIITGIGFLGAGNIIKSGEHIKGLTTAAAIWAVASIGMMSGLGYWSYAIVAAAAILGINLALTPLDRVLKRFLPVNQEETSSQSPDNS